MGVLLSCCFDQLPIPLVSIAAVLDFSLLLDCHFHGWHSRLQKVPGYHLTSCSAPIRLKALMSNMLQLLEHRKSTNLKNNNSVLEIGIIYSFLLLR